MELTSKRALVTGGGHGLGRGIAEALWRAGATVTICGRNEQALAETLAASSASSEAPGTLETRVAMHSVVCDVTSAESVAQAVRYAEERMGGVDFLINNAGIAPTAPIKALTLATWQEAFAVNATGTFLCTQACLGGMLERKYGRVINIASVAGVTGGMYLAAYCASKHAVIGFTRAAAAELGDKGVQVNAICPAYVDTDMTRGGVARVMRSKGASEQDALNAVLTSAGQKRLLPVSEVASWVVHLCGPAGNALNGQVIVLDGGGKE